MQTKNTKQGGFTLVEIAIVLVIIGLLLGGILKGQELINNAKVRSVADRQNSLKAAWFGFIDRYNFIPGDSRRAPLLVPGAKPRSNTDGSGDGFLTIGESVLVMQQLTGAGFLRCPQCDGGPGATDADANTDLVPNADNSLVNQYSGIMSIWHDDIFYAERDRSSSRTDETTASGRLQIHSGPRIPSNILSEVDRKIDDGIANTGDLVFNNFDPSSGITSAEVYGGSATATAPDSSPIVAECTNLVTDTFTAGVGGERDSVDETFWRTTDRDPSIENNCGASVFI